MRELVVASVFGMAEREGSNWVKLSLIHRAEHMEERGGWTTDLMPLWEESAPLLLHLASQGRWWGSLCHYVRSFFRSWVTLGLFLYYCKFVKNVICLSGAQGENGGLSLFG